jgi:hypothetical protein
MTLTNEQMELLITQTDKYGSLTNSDLMKLVTQYAVKHTKALTEERAMLIEAAMRLEKIKD